MRGEVGDDARTDELCFLITEIEPYKVLPRLLFVS